MDYRYSTATAGRRALLLSVLICGIMSVASCGSSGPLPISPQPTSARTSVFAAPAQPPSRPSWSQWPSAQHDARHSGASVTPGPTSGVLKWQRHLEGAATGGPVVGVDGTIYAASNGGVLHALNPSTGADLWTYDCGHTHIGDDLSVSPLVLPDGTVLWPTPGRELLALSPTGRLLWSTTLPGQPTSPASVDGHRIYVGDVSGSVTALDVAPHENPRVVWTIRVGAVSYGSVVVGDNRRVYTTADSALIAIDDSGPAARTAWTANPGDDITEVSAGLAPDGTVLLGTNGSREWAYRPNGTLAWHAARVITYSSPSITATGLAYVADHSGTVHVLRIDDGAEVVAYHPSRAQIWSSVVIDSDYRVYFGTQAGHLVGLGADGTILFDLDLGAPVDSYPALTADATLVVGTRSGTLTAIR